MREGLFVELLVVPRFKKKKPTHILLTNLKLFVRIFPINTKLELRASSIGFSCIAFNRVYPVLYKIVITVHRDDRSVFGCFCITIRKCCRPL